MTVKYGEMVNLVNAVVSIDQYKPKIGEASETVVVAFEVDQEGAASDLSNLIETDVVENLDVDVSCLLYTSPSPRDLSTSRMPSSA